jgi:hypothetical protein
MNHANETPPGGEGLAKMFPGGNDRENAKPLLKKQASPVIGIDIGACGAVAILSAEVDLIDVFDMPVLHDGPKGRRTVNGPLLADLVYKSHATEAFIEHVSSRPGEAVVSAFAFGRSRGIVEGVLAACAVPALFITPSSWKRPLASLSRARTPLAPKQSVAGHPTPHFLLASRMTAAPKARWSALPA